MIFSDLEIRRLVREGLLKIHPLDEASIRPASVCLHLADELLLFNERDETVNLNDPSTFPEGRRISMTENNGFELSPKGFVLAATEEEIGLSRGVAGHVSNISGLARLGITVELSTHVAPGFGESSPRSLTLEIHNASPFTIRFSKGIRICHLVLHAVDPAATIGYDEMFPGKYSATGPLGSEFAD